MLLPQQKRYRFYDVLAQVRVPKFMLKLDFYLPIRNRDVVKESSVRVVVMDRAFDHILVYPSSLEIIG